MNKQNKLSFYHLISLILLSYILNCQVSLADDNSDMDQKNIAIIKKKVIKNSEELKCAFKDGNTAKLKKIFYESVDTDGMAKFAIGTMNDKMFLKNYDKNKAFIDAYKAYLENYKFYLFSFYLNAIKSIEHMELKTIRIHRMPPFKPNIFRYSAQITLQDNNQTIYNIIYVIHKKKEQFYIFDIIAENVSVLQAQRADFTKVVRDKENVITLPRLQELNRMLQAKTNS
jgi:ABC-type transporter MlaC component